ncbi:MAG: lysine 2,3-aminomutase, partial [Tagaea sp.]|nr:lysine 2,3-aminomutase [Tagaea sp.]
VKNRIKPYYLHHADPAPGTSHFRTTLDEGRGLMRELRGRLSGLAQPVYVLDIPGGAGKVPAGPDWFDADGAPVPPLKT